MSLFENPCKDWEDERLGLTGPCSSGNQQVGRVPKARQKGLLLVGVQGESVNGNAVLDQPGEARRYVGRILLLQFPQQPGPGQMRESPQ